MPKDANAFFYHPPHNPVNLQGLLEILIEDAGTNPQRAFVLSCQTRILPNYVYSTLGPLCPSA